MYSNLYTRVADANSRISLISLMNKLFRSMKYNKNRNLITAAQMLETIGLPRYSYRNCATNRIINNNGSSNKRLPYDPLPYVSMLLPL